MSERRGLLGEVSWFQVIASALAAVTAAWLASRLGVAGTLIGVAVASFVSTIGSALYGRTLEKSRTLIVQTASGTIVQKAVQDGDIAEAFEEVAEAEHSPVERAEVVTDEKPRLHWKTIIVTTIAVVALALGTISAIELVSGKTLDGSGGTTIGDTFGGTRGDKDEPADPDPTPTPTATTSTPTPGPTSSTATPTPTASTPTPTPTASTPTPTESTATPAE